MLGGAGVNVVAEDEVEYAYGIYLLKFEGGFLLLYLFHDWECGVVDAAVFEELLEHVLHLYDEPSAVLSLAEHVEYGFALGCRPAKMLGVEVLHVDNEVVRVMFALLHQGVEETDQEVFVELRAEEFLEAKVGVWVYVAFLCHILFIYIFSANLAIKLEIANTNEYFLLDARPEGLARFF